MGTAGCFPRYATYGPLTAAGRKPDRSMKRTLPLFLSLLLIAAFFAFPLSAMAADAQEESGEDAAEIALSPRDDLINRYIETGRQLFVSANGKLQRAHYAGDIYVCKNFTVHVFRENSGDFRMMSYPAAELTVPSNLPAQQCKPYSYGYCWEDVPPEEGNPFYVAAQFLYDTNQTKQENMERALEFMRQVKRGDYFQMSAEYYYGMGAHSAIMISDYDPQTDTVHWMDSNMAGEKRNGIRYGKVQYDMEKNISWWADAFCKRTRGATIYRLRDDIVYYNQN